MELILFYISRWMESNKSYFFSNVLFTAIISGITCWISGADYYVTYGATKACLFAILMSAIWAGLFNTITRFSSEAHFAVDELQKMIPVSVYMIANLVIQIALCVMEALIVTFVYWELRRNCGVELEAVWIKEHINMEIFVSFFLIIFSTDMLGFCVGVIVKRINTLMSVVPFLLILQFLFSGCLFELEGNAQWLSVIAIAKYGFAIMGTQADLNKVATYEALTKEIFSHDVFNLLSCWGALGILSVIFFALAGITLEIKVNRPEM